jgi:primosomal protein N' (replication factor Y)
MALRAGDGKMILQTFQPEDPTVQYASNYDFDGFNQEELSLRKILKYPPYTYLIKLTYQDKTKKEVDKKTQEVYDQLQKIIDEISTQNKSIIISQPYDPLVNKIRSKYKKQILIKTTQKKLPKQLYYFLTTLNTKWTVDIDPVTIS